MSLITHRFTLLNGALPGRVEVVVSDNRDLEQATTSLVLRLQCNAPYNRSVVLAEVEALRSARKLIDDEIERLQGLQSSSGE